MRIQVLARNQGLEFEARARETVLFAGLRAGIELPYECATGTCGTCKAKLISGRLHDGWREAPGRKHVKPEQREFLMCQCAAEGEAMLEVSKFVYAMEPGARYSRGRPGDGAGAGRDGRRGGGGRREA